jgi:hypothetical protein
MAARIEITKESGEVAFTKRFPTEELAHDHFDSMEKIRSPHTYEQFTMNCSEFSTGGNIGSIRLIAEIGDNDYIRRELYRNA